MPDCFVAYMFEVHGPGITSKNLLNAKCDAPGVKREDQAGRAGTEERAKGVTNTVLESLSRIVSGAWGFNKGAGLALVARHMKPHLHVCVCTNACEVNF